MTSPQTIFLKGSGLSQRADEARAAGAITPGHLIQHNAAGGVVVHATAGGPAEMNFAKEDSFQGKTIADAYANLDLVFFHRAQKGDEIYALLATANNADPSKLLASNGDGTFKVSNGTTDVNLVKPVESLNNVSGVPARLRVRVL